MNAMLSRRVVIQTGLAAGGLMLGLRLPGFSPGVAGAATTVPATVAEGFAPNAFIRIDRQGLVTLIMPNAEFGQGIWTSACMLIAEELEVGLDQVTPMAAPPDASAYTDPLLGEQATGGSASIRGDWKRLREAGAVGRTLLIQAAAQQWSVDPGSCSASRAVVTHAASGRTLGYGALVDAAALLPVPTDVPIKEQSAFKLIGTAPRRLDTPPKVDGTAIYGIDVKIPGMGIGTVSACPVKGGKLKSFNEAAARAVKGVRDVVALDDVIAVIGDHMWAAKQGLQAAAAQWDEGPNAATGMKLVIERLDTASKTEGVVAKDEGDVASVIGASVKKLDVVYQLPFLAHAPMEPINTTLHVRPDGADVWVGTQVPVRAQATVAKETGLPIGTVKVHSQIIGGAFGRRLDVDSITQAARIARHVSYPVKLIWTREEDIQHDLYRPYYYDRISAGLDADGKVTGWSHRVTGSSVMARWAPPGMKMDGKLDPDAVEGATETPYRFPAQKTEYVRHEPNEVTTLWWRGVGPTHNVFVVESVIDELAALASKDPVEFRRALLPADDHRTRAVLDLAVEKSGWGSALPTGSGRGVALQVAFGTIMATVAEVVVTAKGEVQVKRVTVALDCGPVVNPDTVKAQVQGGIIFGLTAALYNEITIEKGRVQQSNFHDYRMMRINEAPAIDVHIVHNPTGSIGGIGETGTVAAAPALANAIFAATGRRLRRIPFATGQLNEA
ncbi:xanthine dehydrogenase family protein molybdopterin-binding subunit [Lichenicola cladoniae]|uniref:Xanthine dehydrogenase family protein molybdopterin-binding subunit n=1 Tax=Lichenicola cladoniae TaxID=1484109 RepID=A0A6M8HL82_9PROT|nr:molybdopterin cofactor-binding domain-containing protein [Lichenicola cladoniae]NPD68941.1 xanthine dehydrogenase family protein molybdopterin-binding subunit [Acetobacteraceae bacterium]QKE89113.1 xanthine dehydrogenase family protein molybdopterin-binding subunit [Lichenicola cladoniae]